MPFQSQQDSWSPTNYLRHANFVYSIPQQDLITLLAPKSYERILDLGCGDGALTFQIQQLCKECIGIDKSHKMIKAAQEKGCNDVRVVDGEKLSEWIENEGFEGSFDAIFSNAAIHWMKNQKAVIEGVHKCLKPGGRFVAEMGGHGNVEVIEKSLIATLDKLGYDGTSLSPWYFPSQEEFENLLIANSFKINSINLFPRPTHLPTNLIGWIETFGFSFLEVLKETERNQVINKVVDMCKSETFNEKDNSWIITYVRLRVVAKLE
ncbi:hypothetical protein Glove_146g45 [Diversispora epigaea]|uniref:Methyltransferase type 11 domain-containing protein n=1 Tax=Diversispora epigaea TaxID=1348612 RepID=A0A397J3E2_9GLOM|nr:hypothetical protein Glove_146g45 [Diversispora epigaea]